MTAQSHTHNISNTSNTSNLEDLIKTVELHHEQYIRSLRSLHDVLGVRNRRDRADSRNIIIQDAITPPLRCLTFTSEFLSRPRRDTLEAPERPSFCPSPRPLPLTPNPNASEGGGFAIADEDLSFIPLLDQAPSRPRTVSDEPLITPPPPSSSSSSPPSRVQSALIPMRFSDDMLLRHIRDSEFSDEIAGLLDEEVLRRRWDIDVSQPFYEFAAFERERFVSSTFEVYEVAVDATAVRVGNNVDMDVHGFVKYVGGDNSNNNNPLEALDDDVIDSPTLWEAIKDVNPSGKSVGRITIVQEPTPLMLAALHLTMSPHFDMTELLHHLLSDTTNRGRTHAFMRRAFERPPSASSCPSSSPPIPPMGSSGSNIRSRPTPLSFSHLRQRSFFFVFKYYTVISDGLEPTPWQRYEKRPSDKRLGDHIDIAECGSVLALSLGGKPTKTLRMRPRRERAREGFLFDTFGPWHLLSIQSFPDDEHTVRGEDFELKSFYNGPYAFLELLIAEYRDAGKRNQILHERITKLITPPPEFMFDHRLRDKLLFEDKHFTYIRRYFWAYNTLAVINTGIKAMISAYIDTFTDDFWLGSHPILWPHPAPESVEGLDYRGKMSLLRRELDKVVSDLGEVLKKNERTRKEIENLRDQLFSGSSIKESRRAIDQGDNIWSLTMISMIFLPLTFVTSVFGITEFKIPVTDWRFALTMVLVCVPFMILVYLFQTRAFASLARKLCQTFSSFRSVPRAILSRYKSSEVNNVPDSRPGSTPPPPRGRKRRLIVGRRRRRGGSTTVSKVSNTTTTAAAAAATVKWPWSWIRKASGVEDIDLPRIPSINV